MLIDIFINELCVAKQFHKERIKRNVDHPNVLAVFAQISDCVFTAPKQSVYLYIVLSLAHSTAPKCRRQFAIWNQTFRKCDQNMFTIHILPDVQSIQPNASPSASLKAVVHALEICSMLLFVACELEVKFAAISRSRLLRSMEYFPYLYHDS